MIKRIKAFSLIELIITILVLIVIGSASVAFFVPMMNIFFYSPSQLMVDQTAQELLNVIVEGDNRAKGLRYSKHISAADEDTITFVNSDDDTIIYRWDATDEIVYRNINGAGDEAIPAKYFGTITVRGRTSDSQIFLYYDSSASTINVPVASPNLDSIEAIRMDLTIEAGTGNVKANQGRIDVRTGIDIKQY